MAEENSDCLLQVDDYTFHNEVKREPHSTSMLIITSFLPLAFIPSINLHMLII